MIRETIQHKIHRLADRVTRISGMDYEPERFSLEQLLVAVSGIYGAVSGFRSALYRQGRLKRKSLPCPVISVGNVTAGGTGKTPTTIFLADLLRRMGRKPAVLSRGYKGTLDRPAAVVGDGTRIFLDAKTAGDEPMMMATRGRFPVVVGKDRHAAGCLALEACDADVLILDDGFQHLKLKRDLDLVLMDHDRPLGNGRILPAGRLREPPDPAVQQAHAILLTRCPDRETDGPHPVCRRFPGKPVFRTRHRPFLAGWVPGGAGHGAATDGHDTDGVPRELSELRHRNLVLFSGIADNAAFARTMASLGGNILDHLEFTDHYRYKGSDLCRIRQAVRGGDLLVTTEKDWVKLPQAVNWQADVAVVGIRLEIAGAADAAAFEDLIRHALSTRG